MKKEKVINTNGEAAETKKSSGIVLKIVLALILLVVIVYFGFTCTVREGDCAVVLRFGAPRAEITEPGLYFKLPWPFESVYTYDARLQHFESKSLEITTKDNRNIILQSYAFWSVKDPLTFHNTIGSADKAEAYINDQIYNATNSVMGSYNLTGLVSLDAEQIKTDEIQAKIFKMVKDTCEKNYGITVKDVSILRISLPDTNLETVFEQMRAARQKDIDAILAQAKAQANILSSKTDEEYSQIIAEAQKKAAEINERTAADVAAIYAKAQQANTELYTFLKELDSIVASVSSDTVLVVTAETYPFNVLLDYGDKLATEDTVVTDLQYILSKIKTENPEVYDDFVKEIYELLKYSKDVKTEDELIDSISYKLEKLADGSSEETEFINEIKSVLKYTYTESEDKIINDLVDLLAKLKKEDTAESKVYESFIEKVTALVEPESIGA